MTEEKLAELRVAAAEAAANYRPIAQVKWAIEAAERTLLGLRSGSGSIEIKTQTEGNWFGMMDSLHRGTGEDEVTSPQTRLAPFIAVAIADYIDALQAEFRDL